MAETFISLQKASFSVIILLISDIHSNLEALNAVLGEARYRKVLCAGDYCGYGANPNEVVEIAIKHNIPGCLGNHDSACLTEDIFGFNPFAAEAVRWTFRRLNPESRKFLMNLPKILRVDVEGVKICMVHGSPRDPLDEYVQDDLPVPVFESFLKATGADILVMGHTHVPYVMKVDGKLIINPGSVGQPRDNDSRASCALVDTKKMQAEIVKVKYDVETAAKKIREAGLPVLLAERLKTGW